MDRVSRPWGHFLSVRMQQSIQDRLSPSIPELTTNLSESAAVVVTCLSLTKEMVNTRDWLTQIQQEIAPWVTSYDIINVCVYTFMEESHRRFREPRTVLLWGSAVTMASPAGPPCPWKSLETILQEMNRILLLLLGYKSSQASLYWFFSQLAMPWIPPKRSSQRAAITDVWTTTAGYWQYKKSMSYYIFIVTISR